MTNDTEPSGRVVNDAAWATNTRLAEAWHTASSELQRARDQGITGGALRRLERAANRAAEALFDANRGLARRVAGRYVRRCSDPRDLYQVAETALWESILSWNPQLSPLGSWAWRRVDKACRAEIALVEHQLSPWVFERRPAVLAAAEDLRRRGEPVTTEAVAALAGVTPWVADQVLGENRLTLSLDAVEGPDGTALSERLAAGDEPTLAPSEEDGVCALTRHTERLQITELVIWLLNAGVSPRARMSTQDIGGLFGVSAESVRRLVLFAKDQLNG